MAEQSIPVSVIRKVLAEELASKRRLSKHNDAGLDLYLDAVASGQNHFIKMIEFYTGTPILRRRKR